MWSPFTYLHMPQHVIVDCSEALEPGFVLQSTLLINLICVYSVERCHKVPLSVFHFGSRREEVTIFFC